MKESITRTEVNRPSGSMGIIFIMNQGTRKTGRTVRNLLLTRRSASPELVFAYNMRVTKESMLGLELMDRQIPGISRVFGAP